MSGLLRLGIDIGGTFTDFGLVDPDGRRIGVHKQLTTPRDPAEAVLEGIGTILAQNGFGPGDLAEIVHGTTLVTNALIERRGARTGMLVTEGFRDLFDIGKEQRYDLFDLRLRFAEPLVPRPLRAEVRERVWHDGSVLVPLDEEGVRESVRRLVEEDGIEALAICFLHPSANPAHETRAREIVAELYPDLPVSASGEVFPYIREFERWTTACANAYAQPLVERYLGRIARALRERGIAARLWVVSASGGLLTPEAARRYPVRLLESGPAAGVLMSARFGRELGLSHVLSFDLGGTTAKGALVRDGEALRTYSFEAAHAYRYRSGSGLTLQIPVVDMNEIGAGGGSIARVDELGRMRVGPSSAGAEPGPACYGRGGERPTLTDANLVLGYLDPDFFLGGRMSLDGEAAGRAIRESVADPLGIDLIRAAWGIHDLANEDIARAFRMHATERGFDYRRCAIAAFGGGGPIHAGRIARKLGAPRVVYPAGAGVMSAFGMLAGAQSFEVMRAFARPADRLSPGELGRALRDLEEEVSAFLLAGGLAREAIRIRRRADMRYLGQGYDIEVPLPGDADDPSVVARLPGLFAERYREAFHAALDEPVEIVSLKVEAIGPEPAGGATVRPPRRESGGRESGGALKGSRPIYLPERGGFADCPVYDRYRLAPGASVHGPALIEERESTVLLDEGDIATVDARGDLLAEIAASRVSAAA